MRSEQGKAHRATCSSRRRRSHRTVAAMGDDELIFESTTCLSQDEFAAWIQKRPAHDDNHYELLNGRIVVTPPASWPHGEVGSLTQLRLAGHIVKRKLGRVFDSSQGF